MYNPDAGATLLSIPIHIEPQFSINILKIEVRENIISGLVGLTVVRTLVAVRIKKNEQERFCFIIFSIVFILITSKY